MPILLNHSNRSSSPPQASGGLRESSKGVLFALLAVVLLGIICFGIYKLTMQPKPAPQRPQTLSQEDLKRLAVQSFGDFRRLSPSDQQNLYAAYGSRAVLALQQAYRASHSH